MATHLKKHNRSRKNEFTPATEENEEYATIVSARGDSRFIAEIVRTGKQISVTAPGKLKKGPNKQRIKVGDTVLIQEGPVTYILAKYSDEEVRKLNKMGELITMKSTAVDAFIGFDDDVNPENTEFNSKAEINIDDI